jgi:hypothetical protein
MDSSTLIGIAGGVILVAGAAFPERAVRPYRSVKDWLFAVGGIFTLAYSIMNYLAGGTVFFVFLQGLVNLSSVFMMFEVDERIGTPIIGLGGLGLIVWSLWLLPGYSTIFFILGLAGIAMGYCSKGGTSHREFALALGSALITYFSYIENNQVFFWLNLFFALFAGIQLLIMRGGSQESKKVQV